MYLLVDNKFFVKQMWSWSLVNVHRVWLLHVDLSTKANANRVDQLN